MAPPSVHLLAGLNGAGKTTLARRLETELPAVRFTLDEWVLRLRGLPFDHLDYPAAAARCQELIWDTATQVLRTGTSVVLDWNLWSRSRRAEWVGRAQSAGAAAVLHLVDVTVERAIAQVQARVDPTAHPLTETEVIHLAGLFERPTPAEAADLGCALQTHLP